MVCKCCYFGLVGFIVANGSELFLFVVMVTDGCSSLLVDAQLFMVVTWFTMAVTWCSWLLMVVNGCECK